MTTASIAGKRARRAGAAAALLGLLGSCCMPKRVAESMRVLAGVARRGETHVEDSVARTPVHYEVQGRTHSGDLYLARGVAPEAAVLLVPGAAREGKEHPTLVIFARMLGQARFAVLVPDLVNVRRLKVGARDVRDIADGVAFFLSRPDLAPQGRVGIAAASYAVGSAVLAALEPDVHEHVRFVLGIGGYYDMTAVITFVTTGWYRDRTLPSQRWRRMQPNEYGKWAFVMSNVDRVREPSDRQLLRTMAQRRMADERAPVDALATRLRGEGRAVYALLINQNPELVPGLIQQLPPGVKADIAGLDVSRRDLSALHAQLILVHGRYDDSIPFTESKALARAAPHARLFIVAGLAHVEIEHIGPTDTLRLLCAVDALLDERER